MNFQMLKLILEKAEESEIKLPTSAGSSKKQESSRKTSISALLTMQKPLCRSQETMENSSRNGNTRPPDLSLEKPICRSGSNIMNSSRSMWDLVARPGIKPWPPALGAQSLSHWTAEEVSCTYSLHLVFTELLHLKGSILSHNR